MKLPAGSIIIWSGTTIPDGWVMCDGNNGTPNLINRFVRGASIDGDLRVVSGSTTHYHGNAAPSAGGGHGHTGISKGTGSASTSKYYGYASGTLRTGSKGHDHGTISLAPDAIANHSHSLGNTNADANTSMPPYKIFVFIMKVD